MRTDLTIHAELNPLDEQELVARVQKGDREAFTPLMYKYQQKIYNLIYRKVRNHETAEDLCQEVFLKAWQALPNFKGQSLFYSWLYQIAVNRSIDFLRKRNRQYVTGFEELPQNADDTLQMTEVQPSPCALLERKELEQIILKAVYQLPLSQRSAFYLRHWDGLPIKEIASRLDKSENTVKTYLYHARRKLQRMLLPYLQNEPLVWYQEN
jgi:RNA polymerase sigma-70 factor (ECF subfamily)